MSHIYSKYKRKYPGKPKYPVSMDAILMPGVGRISDSGFSVAMTEEELQDVKDLFEELSKPNEEDN